MATSNAEWKPTGIAESDEYQSEKRRRLAQMKAVGEERQMEAADRLGGATDQLFRVVCYYNSLKRRNEYPFDKDRRPSRRVEEIFAACSHNGEADESEGEQAKNSKETRFKVAAQDEKRHSESAHCCSVPNSGGVSSGENQSTMFVNASQATMTETTIEMLGVAQDMVGDVRNSESRVDARLHAHNDLYVVEEGVDENGPYVVNLV